MNFHLPPAYTYKLDSLPRGRSCSSSISNTCKVPYSSVSVDSNGNCMICSCDGWLPIPVGKVEDFSCLEDVWNCEIAKVLQRDIDDKKFTWCAVDHCGIKTHSFKSSQATLSINIDDSCNLHCPSCRREPIMSDSGPKFEYKLRSLQRILHWLEQFDDNITVTLSGNGDPLASHIIRPLFRSYQPKPTQKFALHTNGLLMQKQLNHSALMTNVVSITVSIDAGSDAVYRKTRRGGDWAKLLQNLDWLRDVGLIDKASFKFALQQKNFKDMMNFVNLCHYYGVDGVIHQLEDWGTWSTAPESRPDTWTIQNGIFADHDILDPQHPEHQQCKQLYAAMITLYENRMIRVSNQVKSILS